MGVLASIIGLNSLIASTHEESAAHNSFENWALKFNIANWVVAEWHFDYSGDINYIVNVKPCNYLKLAGRCFPK